MPYSILSDEQILAVLAERQKMLSVRGVALVRVEFLDSARTEAGVVVTVYAGKHQEMGLLPMGVAGVPVIVEVEDRRTMRVVEVIDPRKHGGQWPSTNHNG